MRQLYPYRPAELKFNYQGHRITWREWLLRERKRIKGRTIWRLIPGRYARRRFRSQPRAVIMQKGERMALFVEEQC